MHRVKETPKKPVKVLTNKSFTNRKNGDTGPKASKKIKELESKAIPESKAFPESKTIPESKAIPESKTNQESKNLRMRKPYQGKKNNPGAKTNQEKMNQRSKAYQKPKINQKPKTYQPPARTYQPKHTYLAPGKYEWQKVNNYGKKYKNCNQGSISYQGSTLHYSPNSYQVPSYYQKPGIYQPEEQFRKYKDYKVPEISVSELCRTLTGLKAIEQEQAKNKNDDNKASHNDQAGSSGNKKNSSNSNEDNEGNSPDNEPYFVSNLEYYPHLPQVYFSEQYQTFAQLKATVSQGDLTQTTEQRQAYLRNQRALDAQRIGRHERHLREQQEKEQQKSSKSKKGDWGQRRETRQEQTLNVGLYMPAQCGMEVQMPRQGLQKDEHEMKKELGKLKLQKQQVPEQKQEPVLCSFLEEQQRLRACFLKDQRELKERRQKEQDLLDSKAMEEAYNQRKKEAMEFVAQLKLEFEDKKKVEELEARRQEEARKEKEMKEQLELEARIQRQKKAMEFVAQLQFEFEEQKKQEEAEARRLAEQKKQEQEAEAARQEHDLYEARRRNERARTAQRVGRETRRFYQQLQYEFRFGRKDLGQDDGAKLPPVLFGPRAPSPSELPKPESTMVSGKAPNGTENGNGTGN